MKSVLCRYFHTSRKIKQAAIAQSVVRNIGSVEVTGSIPVSSSKQNKKGISKKLFFEIPFYSAGQPGGAARRCPSSLPASLPVKKQPI